MPESMVSNRVFLVVFEVSDDGFVVVVGVTDPLAFDVLSDCDKGRFNEFLFGVVSLLTGDDNLLPFIDDGGVLGL